MKNGLSKLLASIVVLGAVSAWCHAAPDNIGQCGRSQLKFKPDGTFKIVQFTDTQDDQSIDPRTVALIQAVLDDQRPDLVVFTGDNITKGPQIPDDVRVAINHVVAPVDTRGIPWFITFGNHDEDHTAVTGVDEEAMLRIYMSYRFNVNERSPKNINGTGNVSLLIHGARNSEPVFGVWGLDSGRYSPEEIAGQYISEDFLLGWTWMPDWDWIRPSQVEWYTQKSEGYEKIFKRKIPSLMFFHIPLQEFRTMYENDAYKAQHPELGLLPQHGVSGERNEDECPGPFNSGLFSALLERGDVKGLFVGHDHVNNYVGNYFGITLGYSANTGFGTYGLGGAENDRLRGARLFVLNEENLEDIQTFMVYASQYRIH
jgi:3',5'-cyclic AMP phosphodiesterase CpdA